MKIIPAIDLHNGKCVRLLKGDFDKVTEYSGDPLDVARGYKDLTVEDLHIVDLDGARTGTPGNADIVRRLCDATGFSVQLGGGIRSRADVGNWLENGVSRCVLGSFAIANPDLVGSMIGELGSQCIVVALDVNLENGSPVVATHGWERSSGLSLWECIDQFADYGVEHVLCTDISRDGAMAGPNFSLYADVMQRYPDLQVQASGGVRDISDIETLAELGVPAAITGKAMLDGKISAAEVAAFLQNE